MALTDTAHQLICEHFADVDLTNKIAVDATCGNGHDTLFLAKLGFNKVYSFDIQRQAIHNTKQLIEKEKIDSVYLIKAGHETIAQHVKQQIHCAMFNLGYLPHGDKNITSSKLTSLEALKQSLALLTNQGIASVVCYPGHPEGLLETNAVKEMLEHLNKKYKVSEVLASHPSTKSPKLYLVQFAQNT